MAVCLDYQTVYSRRDTIVISVKMQIILASMVLALLGLKVWMKLEITELGYQTAKQRQETMELDLRRRELEMERSVILRHDNLQAAAAKRLGLKPLSPTQARKISLF